MRRTAADCLTLGFLIFGIGLCFAFGFGWMLLFWGACIIGAGVRQLDAADEAEARKRPGGRSPPPLSSVVKMPVPPKK